MIMAMSTALKIGLLGTLFLATELEYKNHISFIFQVIWPQSKHFIKLQIFF